MRVREVCAVCSVQCAVCSVQCAVCSVQCAVCVCVCVLEGSVAQTVDTDPKTDRVTGVRT